MSSLEADSSTTEAEPILAAPVFHSNAISSLAEWRPPTPVAFPRSGARQRVQQRARREFYQFSRTSGGGHSDGSKEATESTTEELKGNEVGLLMGGWNRFVNVVSAIDTFIVKILLNPAPQSERWKRLQAARELDPGLRYRDWHLDDPTPEPSDSGSDIEDQDTFPTGYMEPSADDDQLSEESQGGSGGDFITELSSFVGNLEEEVRELRNQLYGLRHSVTSPQGDHEELTTEFNSLCWTYIQSEPPSPVTAAFTRAEHKTPGVGTMQRSRSCSDLSSLVEAGHLTWAKSPQDRRLVSDTVREI